MKVFEVILKSIQEQEDKHIKSLEFGVFKGTVTGFLGGFGLDELKEFLKENSILPTKMAEWNPISGDYEMVFTLPINQYRDQWTSPLRGPIKQSIHALEYHFKHFRVKKLLQYLVDYQLDIFDTSVYYIQLVEDKRPPLAPQERINLITSTIPINLSQFVDTQVQKTYLNQQFTKIQLPLTPFKWKRLKDGVGLISEPPKKFREFTGDYYLYQNDKDVIPLTRVNLVIKPYIREFNVLVENSPLYEETIDDKLNYYFPRQDKPIFEPPTQMLQDTSGMGFDDLGEFSLHFYDDIPMTERIGECIKLLKEFMEPLPILSSTLDPDLLSIVNNTQDPQQTIKLLYNLKKLLDIKFNTLIMFEQIINRLMVPGFPLTVQKFILEKFFGFSHLKELNLKQYQPKRTGLYLWKWKRTQNNPLETLRTKPFPNVFKDCKNLDFKKLYSFGDTRTEILVYKEYQQIPFPWKEEVGLTIFHSLYIGNKDENIAIPCSRIREMRFLNNGVQITKTSGSLSNYPASSVFSYCLMISIYPSNGYKHIVPIKTWLINK